MEYNEKIKLYGEFISQYLADERTGVKTVVAQAEKQKAMLEKEISRVEEMMLFERKYADEASFICGVDEVGRGPLVGPVVAACVILPKNYVLDGLTDSKKLSEKKRDYFYDIIMKDALGVGFGIIDNNIIDEINIYEATKKAMIDAINGLSIKPDIVLTDAMKLDINIETIPIIKGDLKSITISAASVIAKVTRDRMMQELDKKYPFYNFKNNKGYPTKDHIKAIEEHGILKEHRKTYAPIKNSNYKIIN
jgi:ribonuclease HII